MLSEVRGGSSRSWEVDPQALRRKGAGRQGPETFPQPRAAADERPPLPALPCAVQGRAGPKGPAALQTCVPGKPISGGQPQPTSEGSWEHKQVISNTLCRKRPDGWAWDLVSSFLSPIQLSVLGVFVPQFLRDLKKLVMLALYL